MVRLVPPSGGRGFFTSGRAWGVMKGVDASKRFFLVPDGGGRGREAVPLVDAVRKVAGAMFWPNGEACVRLAEWVEAGRLAVVELQWEKGRALPADDAVWQAAVPERQEHRVGRDKSGREFGYMETFPAVSGVIGRAGVVLILRSGDAMLPGSQTLFFAVNRRIGLLLDELDDVLSQPAAVEAPLLAVVSDASAAPVQARKPRRVGKRVAGLPDDVALAQELSDEKAKRKHGATKRLAEKYGCSVDTIQRAVGRGTKPKPGSSAFTWGQEED